MLPMALMRRLVVALVALGLAMLVKRFGLDLRGNEELIADVIIYGGSAVVFIVWPDKAKPDEPPPAQARPEREEVDPR